jgi:hypothetical protein
MAFDFQGIFTSEKAPILFDERPTNSLGGHLHLRLLHFRAIPPLSAFTSRNHLALATSTMITILLTHSLAFDL